jgi:hypothetical protein
MNRNERGSAQSDISHISRWVDSGMAATWSANVCRSQPAVTGILPPAKSQLPVPVSNVTVNRQGLRPRSPPVPNRANTSVRAPAVAKTSAEVSSLSET